MGFGASKEIGEEGRSLSLSDVRSNSTSVEKPSLQDENEKAMEEHQNYLVSYKKLQETYCYKIDKDQTDSCELLLLKKLYKPSKTSTKLVRIIYQIKICRQRGRVVNAPD